MNSGFFDDERRGFLKELLFGTARGVRFCCRIYDIGSGLYELYVTRDAGLGRETLYKQDFYTRSYNAKRGFYSFLRKFSKEQI